MPPPRVVDPFEEAKRLFLDGVALLESGHPEAAEQCFQSSLELQPGRISTLVNLAAARLDLGRAEEALAAADQVLAAEADNLDAWFHRGTAFGLMDRNEEALASFDRLLAIDDSIAEPWLRHGQVLQSLKRPEQALASYERALAIDPTLAQAWTNRGGILQELKRLEEAAAAFRQALAHGGSPELNGYYLAAVGAAAAPAIAPAAYVSSLFDDYADQFDEHLVKVLHYRAPAALAAHLVKVAPRQFGSALDLGCGTGLCARSVKPIAGRLTGVDLSRQMLDKAKALGLYDRLVQDDIIHHLRTSDGSHDLVLAADVFIYVGDLAPIFAGVARVLSRGGVFCFSAEVAGPACESFELLPSLRYAHAECYLRNLAQAHGFEVAAILQEPLREDQRKVVDGLFVYLIAG
jgi:predicted TPR repeat methyltransferase